MFEDNSIRDSFEKIDKENPIMLNNTEMQLFKKWASDYWYIQIHSDYCLVKKGRTRKKFKFIKYETSERLIEDIKNYMTFDYCQYRTKR